MISLLDAIFTFLLNAFFLMLGLGVLHASLAIVPALGFGVCCWLLVIPSLFQDVLRVTKINQDR